MNLHLSAARGTRAAVWLLPHAKVRSRDEIVEALDVRRTLAKRSAFWTMLVLAGVIATAGVIADSTATVIGAMIIAPLATPIMGIALSLVLHDRALGRSSLRLVVLGMLAVLVIGVVAAVFLSDSYSLNDNSQITSRTTPTLIDLVAAIATGFAGAIGLARRDVSDVLPGVAVAISLVPPLAVAGVCAGQGAFNLAAGAFVLFMSNVLAMILAGMAMFSLAYRREEMGTASTRGAHAAIAVLVVMVVVILAINTVTIATTRILQNRAQQAAESWISETPGAEVRDVSVVANSIIVEVLAPGALPPVTQLRADLDDSIPSTFDVVVDVTRGQRIDLGSEDAPSAAPSPAP